MSNKDGGTPQLRVTNNSPLIAAVDAVLHGRADAVKDAGRPRPVAIPGVDEGTDVVSTLRLQLPKRPLPKFQVPMPPPDGRKMPTGDQASAAALAEMDKGGLEGMLITLETFFFEGKKSKMVPKLITWLDKVRAVQGNLQGLIDAGELGERDPKKIAGYLEELVGHVKGFSKDLFAPPLHRFPRKVVGTGEILPLTADEMGKLRERFGEMNADKAKRIGILHEHAAQVLDAVVDAGKVLEKQHAMPVEKLLNANKVKGGR